MKHIDFLELDRDRAVILYHGKFYDDSDHSLAFEQCLADDGTTYREKYGFDFDDDEHYDTGIDKAIEVVQALIADGSQLVGFDVWEDDDKKYMVWRPGKKAETQIDAIRRYAEEHNYITGIYPVSKEATYFLVA